MTATGRAILRQGMHIHLVGIGGSGLSAIARVLLGMGYVVSGSDRSASPMTEALTAEGARVYIGHAPQQVAGADLVLMSSAIPEQNPEVAAAQAGGIPVLKRFGFLGELMSGRDGVAVAGTHGKTTTSAMLASVLLKADLDPSFIVGGVLVDFGTNARAGNGAPFVVEADEYDRMFLGLHPRAAVLTAVEHDHPDCYSTIDEMIGAFQEFVSRLPADGLLVACWDDPGARLLGKEMEARGRTVRWYGFEAGAIWQAVSCHLADGSTYTVQRAGEVVGSISLKLPGRHNVLNSLAVVAMGDWLGVPFDCAQQALANFSGVERRFEVKGEIAGVVVVDDYAHHPTKVAATLAAARRRYPDRRIWAVFQPHTYSRTRALMDQFATCFGEADRVIVLDIYAARETDNLGIEAPDLVARMEHPQVLHIGGHREAADYLLANLRPNDVVLTLGAGDGDRIGEWVLDGLCRTRDQECGAEEGEPSDQCNAGGSRPEGGVEPNRPGRDTAARFGSQVSAKTAGILTRGYSRTDSLEKSTR